MSASGVNRRPASADERRRPVGRDSHPAGKRAHLGRDRAAAFRDFSFARSPRHREGGVDPDADIDLDALAEWAILIDTVTRDDNRPVAALAEEPGAFQLDERPRSYGELTERLRREVLPRLRWLAASRGSLTLGHLARVVVNLQGSEAHLVEVRAFVERTGVPISAFTGA